MAPRRRLSHRRTEPRRIGRSQRHRGGAVRVHFQAVNAAPRRAPMLKRLTFAVYGVACYVVFLIAFLYAIAFIGNLGTPTALDGPSRQPFGIALAIDTGLLLLFAAQHSVMARPWFKERWTRLVPKPIERSTYVLFSSVALIVMFWQWQPIGGRAWTVNNPDGRLVLYALFGFGWVLVLVATF